MTQILGWIMKSKAIKLSSITIGGGGLFTLILGLHQDITSKIEKAETTSKEYVQLYVAPLAGQVETLKENVNETKSMVRDIHKYLLNNN